MRAAAIAVAVSLVAPLASADSPRHPWTEAPAGLFEPVGGAVAEHWRSAASRQAAPPVPRPVGAASQPSGDQGLSGAQAELRKLIAVLETQVESPSVDDRTKVELYKALGSARKALAGVDAALARGGRSSKLDETVAEARLLQKLLASYLGVKQIHGYHMKRDAIEVEVAADVAYERIVEKLPFLRGAAGGRLRINPGQQIVTQFNALKAEFYGTLVEAAHIQKGDSRIKALAAWGNDTKVIYPGETFGESIVTTHQMWDLDR